MSLLVKREYVASGRYDKALRRQKVYGLCANCGAFGFAVCCKIRTKNSSSSDIPLPIKYCPTCKCVTILDPKFKILSKEGEVLS